MPKLIKTRDLTIEEIESKHIISSRKEIRLLGFEGNTRKCSIRQKENLRRSGVHYTLCTNNCAKCFYKISNFLNVHKLIKKIKNEQANKLSKA